MWLLICGIKTLYSFSQKLCERRRIKFSTVSLYAGIQKMKKVLCSNFDHWPSSTKTSVIVEKFNI